jgi:hypothetical protein
MGNRMVSLFALTWLGIIVACHVALSLRLVKAPLHPDTGQFLYRGFFTGRGHSFPLYAHALGSWKAFVRKMITPGGADFHYSADFYATTPKTLFLLLSQKIGSYTIAGMVGRWVRNPKSFRYFLIAYNSLTIIAMYVLASHLFSVAAGLASAALLALYLNIPYADSHQIHAEHLQLLPTILAFVCIRYGCGENALWPVFVGGIMGAGILLLKCSSILLCALVVTSPFLLQGGLVQAMGIIAGVGALMGIFLLVCARKRLLASYLLLAWSVSSFTDYKKGIQFTIHKRAWNLGSGSIVERIGMYAPFLAQMSLLIVSSGLFFIQHRYFTVSHSLFLFTWLAVEAFMVVAQGKYYFAHLVSLFPASVLCAGAIIGRQCMNPDPAICLTLSAMLVATILSVAPFWLKNPLRFQLDLYSRLKHPHTLSFAAAEVIAHYVRTHSDPNERVKLWGYNSEFYVLAQRREHQGFNEDKILCDPLQIEGFWGGIWRRWVLRDLAEDPPLFIIDMYGTLNMKVVERVTGFRYQTDMVYHSLYPVYRRQEKRGSRQDVTETLAAELDKPFECVQLETGPISRAAYIRMVTTLFVKGKTREADALTGGGISGLQREWYEYNRIAVPQKKLQYA